MNSEIRIKQLEERVAYLETIAQSSAHEILTAYIHDVAERYGIPFCQSIQSKSHYVGFF